MAAQMENMNLNNLDKSGWKSYRFEQIAKSVSERVDPNNTDLKIYVGLEHLDAENINIKRYGTPDDVDGQKLRCYPGDVIFGKRRAYQRKAAVVDFDGFCSAHAMVLRANPNVIDPRLFPFFLHSDTFMHRAIDISVGSLSPTINWGTLKTQEFLLPPKDQQAKLAELLWAMDAVVEKEMGVLERLDDLKGVLQRISFDKKDMDYIEISKIAKVYSGGTPNRKIPEFWNGDIPWIKTGEVNYQLITDTEERITQLGLQKSATRLFPKGSILVAMYGQGVTRGRVAISGISAACNQACAVIEVNKGQLPEFIYSYLEYKYEELRSLAHGANQQNLNLGMIKSFNFPNLNYEVQEKIVDELESINNSSSDLISQISTSKSLQKSLINQIF